MKKILSCLLLATLLISVPAEAKSMYSKVVLNIRSAPTLEGEIVGQYSRNDEVVIKEIGDEWTKVAFEGRSRYVATRYLSDEKSEYVSYKVSDDSGYKSYMDRACITSKSSPQYKLKEDYEITDEGLCTVGGRYCIAMGSYYAEKIGTKIDLVLVYKGEEQIIPCILGDQKADSDTDSENKKHESDGSYVEFIVRTKELPRMARRMGDVSYAMDSLRGKLTEVRVYEE